jgi:hypothetical protein
MVARQVLRAETYNDTDQLVVLYIFVENRPGYRGVRSYVFGLVLAPSGM